VKKELPTGVVIAIIVVVVALVGWFGWTRISGPRLSKEEQDKFLKPLTLGPGATMPAPPKPQGGPMLPGPGGGAMPAPPQPPP
jgi:hypothetical protein